MLFLLLASAAAASGPGPDALAVDQPPPSPPAATSAPGPIPPTIDSLLSPGADQTTDTDEEPGAASAAPAVPGPVPYGELDSKAYDAALKSGAAQGRAMAGMLDGGWTLASADGQRLYRFQFVGHGGLEQADGAWRDLNGGPGLTGSGVLDQVGYAGDRLMLRFYEASAGGQVEVSVKPSGTGPWSGELHRGATVTPVTFRKD